MSTDPREAGPAAGNLADVVRAAATAAGDRPALLGAGGDRTWSELDAAVDAGATALARYPVGERVVLGLPTGPDLAAALFAVLRAGLVAVPVDPARTDLAWVARRVGAVAAVTDEGVSGAAAVLPSAEVATWWQRRAPGPGAASDGKPANDPARAGGEDLALLARAARIQQPVMLSHRALLGAVAALREATRLGVRPTDRILQILPLFHVVGLVSAFLPAAVAGAAVVVPDTAASLTPAEAALQAVRTHRVSILPAEPTLYRQLDRIDGFERALATVRLMTSGSSPLDPADFTAIRTATGQAVREGYGISESAAVVTSTLLTDVARPGSVGLPYPGVEVRIVTDDGATGHPAGPAEAAGDDGPAAPRPDAPPAADGDGDGEPDTGGGAGTDTSGLVLSGLDDDVVNTTPDEGEVGPIAIRGDTLFSGYWPDGADGPGPDGWYVTGDIGYLDDAGELHLVDRAAETVVVAGFTVYPREVEDILVTHPYVSDAAVVGVPGRAGPTVVAALVPQPGTRPTASDLDEFLTDRLAPFKRPTDYQLVEVLPRTEVGRLDRQAVQRSYVQHRDIPSAGPTRSAATATDAGAESADDQSAPDADTVPEEAAGLNELGRRLPSGGSPGRRSAQDTDDDLF